MSKVAELEDQLDKAGGDAAAGWQAMRSLEAANQELVEEVGGWVGCGVSFPALRVFESMVCFWLEGSF